MVKVGSVVASVGRRATAGGMHAYVTSLLSIEAMFPCSIYLPPT
jgi:hypothetical protein